MKVNLKLSSTVRLDRWAQQVWFGRYAVFHKAYFVGPCYNTGNKILSPARPLKKKAKKCLHTSTKQAKLTVSFPKTHLFESMASSHYSIYEQMLTLYSSDHTERKRAPQVNLSSISSSFAK